MSCKSARTRQRSKRATRALSRNWQSFRSATRNKAGYKFTEVDNQFHLFMAARQIWAKESEGQQPKKREYPIVLSPAVTVEEAMGDMKADDELPAAPAK